MSVRESDRSSAIYHIVDRTPQQVAHGLQQLGKETGVDCSTARQLGKNIQYAEKIAGYSPYDPHGALTGEILSLPEEDGFQHWLQYGIMRDTTYLLGGDEYLADIAKTTAERIDELAGTFIQETSTNTSQA